VKALQRSAYPSSNSPVKQSSNFLRPAAPTSKVLPRNLSIKRCVRISVSSYAPHVPVMSGNASGRNTTAFTTENIGVVAPTLSGSKSRTARVKRPPGRKPRKARVRCLPYPHGSQMTIGIALSSIGDEISLSHPLRVQSMSKLTRRILWVF
jgi:hypothetical protein